MRWCFCITWWSIEAKFEKIETEKSNTEDVRQQAMETLAQTWKKKKKKKKDDNSRRKRNYGSETIAFNWGLLNGICSSGHSV